MKKLITQLLFFCLLAIMGAVIVSCETENGEAEPTDPCENGPEEVEVIDFLHSYTDQNSGIITVEATGGNGDLHYSLDGVDFDESNVFNDLSPGEYTITVMDDSSCTATLEFEVLEFPEVSFSEDILTIINANCQISPCHGTNPSLPSWDGYDNIKARADRLRFMVSERFMPPASSGGSLSDQQITTIQNWVDVGAPNN